MIHQIRISIAFLILASGLCAATISSATTLSEVSSEPFGTFNGVEFIRHAGRFEGTTSMGEYSVPFEIIAPADPAEGTGTFLFEAPHWALAALGRDLVLGRELIFGRGIGYAAVGFGVDGGNILDPTLRDLVIASAPVPSPGTLRFTGPTDPEILIQFADAFRFDPAFTALHGGIENLYAYGISRSADILTEVQEVITGTVRANLFDLAFLHSPLWEPEIPILLPGGPFERIGGEYTPHDDLGPQIFLLSEADPIIFASEDFRSVTALPQARIYEVAGAAHSPDNAELGGVESGSNPIDHWAVMRALFVAGDEWVRFGIEPPANKLLDSAPAGQIDPVYGFETGIARDADGNALGGVRLPDVAVGQGLFIASDPTTGTLGIPFLSPLSGSHVDLECVPLENGSPRFRNHGDYVSRFSRQANRLVEQGFLLSADAEAMKEAAAESDIGKPGSCD